MLRKRLDRTSAQKFRKNALGVGAIFFDDYNDYIADNLHFDMKKPGRRASVRTRNFRRFLSDADAAILAAAGHGDMSAGFLNILAAYQKLYSCGLITLDDIDCHLDKYANKNISNGTDEHIS